ncbi:MAG: nucleoside transporter C-terminal domain-containing protein [Rhodospirillaceae bacterium]|nr:nucleoside transporter C-terminal domain-containing protein [Rhodospirillaceae bacterium]
MLALQSGLGLLLMIALAWALSENRRCVPWRAVTMGVALQFALAVFFLKVEAAQSVFGGLNAAVNALDEATRTGTAFVFGYIGGAEAPFIGKESASTFVLAFQALPLVLVISALSALLFYWNVIPPIVRGFAWVLRRTLGVSGAAGVAVAMEIFVGMTESPLVVRPYLRSESRAALFVIMTAGLATVSGTVMVLYATFLQDIVPNALAQILIASVINAPAAIVMAFIMIPEDPARLADKSGGIVKINAREPGDNAMAVITRGTIDGIQLVFNIIAMLIVLVALVSLANQIVGLLPDVGGAPLSLQRMFGWVMAPLAWALGIPWAEVPAAGELLGTKAVLNELIAYIDMSRLPAGTLSERSLLIMTYALCGFANFSSLGILIGGLGAMVPERRAEIIELAPKALISGTLATCMTGAVVGVLTW